MQVLAWIASILFICTGITGLIVGDIAPAMTLIGIGILALPPLWRFLQSRGINVPVWLRWGGAIALIVVGGSLAPHQSPLPSEPVRQTSRSQEKKDKSATTVDLTAANDRPTHQAEKVASGPQTKWLYSRDFDQMRKKFTYHACITSTNELNFAFPYSGGARGTLCFRNSPQFGKDVILSMDKGQFYCSFNGCTVRMKFDDGRILTFRASEASGGNTNVLFLHGYTRLERLMRKSKHLILEASYFQEGVQQLTFAVSGFTWKH